MTSKNRYLLSEQEVCIETRFNDASHVMVQQAGRSRANGFVKSLFYRQVGQDRYRLLAGGYDDISYDAVVVASNQPFAYANRMRVRESTADEKTRLIYDWESLVRLDLESGEEKTLLSQSISNESDEEYWISQLLSMGADDESLVFIAGSMPKVGSHKEVSYSLSRLVLKSVRVEIIARFADPLL